MALELNKKLIMLHIS